jgi:hypothetical protein
LPVSTDSSLETLLNRTSDGWIVTFVNNNGFSKLFTEPPVIDPSAARTITLSYRGMEPVHRALLWKADGDQELDPKSIRVTVPPGEIRSIRLVLGKRD